MDMVALRNLVRVYPDWPKAGVDFYDIFSIFESTMATRFVLTELYMHIAQQHNGNVDAVVGLGSRGFLLGPPLAFALRVPFFPVRKDGELPEILNALETDNLGNRLVLEGLVGHHVAPVAGGVTDAEEEGFLLRTGPGKGLLAPWPPVHGVVGVLAQVGRGLGGEAVGHDRKDAHFSD